MYNGLYAANLSSAPITAAHHVHDFRKTLILITLVFQIRTDAIKEKDSSCKTLREGQRHTQITTFLAVWRKIQKY